MTRDVYNALKPDVGPKVEDFVDAAMGMIRHEMNDELRSMGDKVKELEQEVMEARFEIVELEGRYSAETPEDKYALTKKKLVDYMKDNGWYD